ncbi:MULTISPECIES: 3-oxoacyl-[acyl-carrier-protein] reductase [Kordiimonas]|jgi:3-oxoacyl-[acyl-carrier protein] reductase|uniref:3-oxoacyl-[acyl-carrier-protein] reductase n=1 Tax=Kordiimonas lacus TaxID=637679 RepID=A0A1G6WW25_9PROT|nr:MULTISPECIES: 3-oxoacyl-[acyl-carrier-protein] reductase [Kordiimonas]SDD70098.1 3-oxoacyl-[acyl-carrier-protein] reductase [Kordiimonas lacus]
MFNLEGKKALVTGATGGIGASIAKTLHAAGAEVAISGTRAEKLEELKAELGDRVHVIAANLSDRASVDQLAKDAADAMGGVDILVNNAGITKDNLAMRMKEDEWDSVMQVNLESSFRLIKALMRGMMKSRWGRVVNITSVVGVTGNPGQANYCASKAGMIGMSKALAAELASRGITVNCVAPGFIGTPMTDVLSDDQKAAITSGIPSGDLGEPEDIASAVLYLASPEAKYVTGQTLHVNGGLAMI